MESEVEKSLEMHPNFPTKKKKCTNVGHAIRELEKLIDASAKHDANPQTRRRRRCNKRPS